MIADGTTDRQRDGSTTQSTVLSTVAVKKYAPTAPALGVGPSK